MTGDDDAAARAEPETKPAAPLSPFQPSTAATPGVSDGAVSDTVAARDAHAFDPAPTAESALTSNADYGSTADAAGTRHPGSTTPEAVDANRSGRSLPVAILGAGVVLLLAAVIYLFTTRPDPDRLAALDKALAEVKAQVASLEARPQPADIGPLASRVEAADKQLAALKDGLAGLQAHVAALPAAAVPAVDVGGQIADVTAKMSDLSRSLEATRSATEGNASALDDAKQQLAAADSRAAALQAKVEAIPTVDLAPLTARVDGVEGKLQPLTGDAEAAKTFQKATEAWQTSTAAEVRAAPLAVTSDAVLRAVEAGKPFADTLTVLRHLGADGAALQPLAAVADTGAPTIADLRADLARLRDALAQRDAPAPTGSYLDRLMAGAATVVRVRPLGSVVGDAPPAILARMDDDLARDDLASALAEWAKLPEEGRTLGKSLAERIRLRQAAAEAARAVGAEAIKAMASARP